LVQETCSDELKQILLSADSKASKGLIFDLRGNNGGLLKNSVKMTSFFLSGGTISTIKSSDSIKHYVANPSSKVYEHPMVVLVNAQTASAGEIMTASLQQNKRALVVGDITFGKGLVQKVFKLSNGQKFHITVSEFLSPNGDPINKVGIVPDYIVMEEKDQLLTALKVLEE
ncbi:MAG TPA: S41 family peptidase, partial [Vampirovibrionales bacterium]